MIYEIYANNEILHYPGDDLYVIEEAVLSETIDEVSTFEFDVYPNNPRYDDIVNSTCYIHILRKANNETKEVFFGKVTEIEITLKKKKHVYVRGILAEMLHAYPRFTPVAQNRHEFFGSAMRLMQPIGVIRNADGNNSMTVGFTITPTSGVYYTIIKHDSNDGKYYKSQVYTSSFELTMNADFFILSISITGEEGDVDCTCSKFELNNSTETGTWTALTSEPSLNGTWILSDPFDFKTFMGSEGTYNSVVIPKQYIKLGSTFKDSGSLLIKGTWQFEGMKDFLTEVREKGIDLLGKHIKVAKSKPSNFQDHTYVVDMYSFEDYGKLSNQKVKYGRNLISFSMTESCENIINVLYPKCINSSGTEITIYNYQATDYHCNKFDYCLQDLESIKKYGASALALEFKNVNEGDETSGEVYMRAQLYNIAKDYLLEKSSPAVTIEASAFDMSYLNDSLNPFDVGDRVIVSATELGLEEELTVPIISKKTYINDLSKNSITMGAVLKNYTDKINMRLSTNNII